MIDYRILLKKLRDWLAIIVLCLVVWCVARAVMRPEEIAYTQIKLIEKAIKIPEGKISLGEKLRGVKEAEPKTITIYKTLEGPVPDERILSLDWNRGRLTFLTDSAREFEYRLGRECYAFSVYPKGKDFFVKYRRAMWERRCVIGATYPLGAFARFDISFGKIFLQGEVTTRDARCGIGWRIF